MEGITTNEEGSEISVILSSGIYSLSSIKKASYKFTDRFGIQIDELDNKNIKVTFNYNGAFSSSQTSLLYNDFINEVLDQDLREEIYAKTENVRNLILANAFSQTSLIDKN